MNMDEDVMITDGDVSGAENRSVNQTSGSDKPKVDYEAKYRGLARRYAKDKAAADQLIGTYEQQLEKMSRELDAGYSVLAKAQQRAQELELQVAEMQKTLKTHELQQVATSLVQTKYPVLKSAWDNGLLKQPSDFPDVQEFEKYLDTFAKTLGLVKTETSEPPAQESSQPDMPSLAPSESLLAPRTPFGVMPRVSARVVGESGADVPSDPNEIVVEMSKLAPRVRSDQAAAARFKKLEAALQSHLDTLGGV